MEESISEIIRRRRRYKKQLLRNMETYDPVSYERFLERKKHQKEYAKIYARAYRLKRKEALKNANNNKN